MLTDLLCRTGSAISILTSLILQNNFCAANFSDGHKTKLRQIILKVSMWYNNVISPARLNNDMADLFCNIYIYIAVTVQVKKFIIVAILSTY